MIDPEIFQTNIEYLKGVGPVRAELLGKELGIFSFWDLLLHFPFRYVDRTEFHKISEISSQQPFVQLIGKITFMEEMRGRTGKRLVARFRDDSGVIELVWFKGVNWIKGNIRPGVDYIIYGKPNFFKGQINIPHPEMKLYEHGKSSENFIRFQPVYSTTEKLRKKGLDSPQIQGLMKTLLEKTRGSIRENLGDPLIRALRLIGREEAFRAIHFPPDQTTLEKARLRLKFEELFYLQLNLLRQKSARQKKFRGHIFTEVGENFNSFYKENLPFELTNAQKRVLKEIRHDLKSGVQMNRLLQGDVGSGKTIVSLMSMLLAKDNGFQAALMAPTEILATQHFNTIKTLLEGMKINVALLTGSTKSAERKELLKALKLGFLDFLIGTHALIEERVKFQNLGLVVIDEQHRFGVAQRARMWAKNEIPPHILVMTATPIPRTLSMTLYGDLDFSIIDELPPGRKPIATYHYREAQRLRVFGFIRKEVNLGRQVYIVYPLIEESAKLDYNNLMEGYESICREFIDEGFNISIVHGRMKGEDKEWEMNRFKKGETQIMVSTTVIEVGVDVPNASVMVIESAERFGLSQLHQLRGRVGRGAEQSYCILLTGNKLSAEGKIRMQTMVQSNDGFKISEVDLELRGPGDIAGTQQSGRIEMKIADLITDQKILKAARYAALKIIDEDKELQLPENNIYRYYLSEKNSGKPNWGLIS